MNRAIRTVSLGLCPMKWSPTDRTKALTPAARVLEDSARQVKGWFRVNPTSKIFCRDVGPEFRKPVVNKSWSRLHIKRAVQLR